MMKTELKLQWLAALLSGEFAQGQTKLRSGQDEYCCLGVLCEVTQAGEWGQSLASNRYNYAVSLNGEHGIASGYMPSVLRRAVGLTSHEQEILSKLNDVEDKNFEYIAKWIAEKVKSEDELDNPGLV